TETVVQPDIVVVCDPGKLDARGCRGAPDWIIEVLSPATAARDHIDKRALYERHGVKEYWLVHPTDRVMIIYRLGNSGYHKPDIRATVGQTPLAVQPHLAIDWAKVFPPLNSP
ncbi:MAG: Uma2 family endonuclease, partial [Gammaproteobacteria bacterium]